MSDVTAAPVLLQSVFHELLDRGPAVGGWMGALWESAARTRPPSATAPTPPDFGQTLPADVPVDDAGRMGTVFDRAVAPPTAFLLWLIENPSSMHMRDPLNFGARSPDARQWREKLFSSDIELVTEAQAEALKQFSKRLAQRGRNKWWAFEGFARVDCCIVTEQSVLFVEGKRTELLPSTLWYPQRSQLWRNVEAAKELAGDRHFGVVLGVDDESTGESALANAATMLAASYPHLDAAQASELSQHLLGFVTWPELRRRFDLVARITS